MNNVEKRHKEIEKLKMVEQFADLIEHMYHLDILSVDEFNNLVALANKLQYQK